LYGGRVDWKCRRRFQTNAAPTAAQRIRDQSLNADDIYYHVFRSGALRAQFEAVRDLDPKDLFLVEQLISYLTAIAGKTRHLDHLYIARQQNSPGSSGGAHEQRFGDWFGRMLVPTWSRDFAGFVERTARALAEADAMPYEAARDWIVASYRMSIAPALLSDILEEPTIKAMTPTVSQLVRSLVKMPESSITRRLARSLYRKLTWVPSDMVYGTELVARAVPGAALDFRPIRDFLRDPG
jgi:hypothetical protein